ncbi:MAG: tetratricopeptide repeat protein [Pirellulales bacterium]|nr:tetratricopeptide repeat protein [Pirellulales bacterium]
MNPLARLVCLLVVAGCLSGCMPSSLLDDPGVSLPAKRPKQTHSQEAIDLNDKAVELLTIDQNEAARLYDKALEIDPGYYVAYSNKANLLIGQKNYVDAISCFERLSNLQPQMAESYVGWAYCLHSTGEESEARRRLRFAIAAYNERLKEKPSDSNILINRALAAYLSGENELARSEIERVLKSHPDSEMAKHLLKAIQAPNNKNDPWALIFD